MRYPLIAELAKALQAPVCILDLETTGIQKNPIRGIVDFAYIKIEANGRLTEFESLLNPQLPIHPEASEVHGLFERDIRNSPKFDTVAAIVQEIFSECIVSGFNTRSFDVNVLIENLDHYGYQPSAVRRQLDVRDIWRKITGAQKGCLSDVAAHFQAQTGTAHRAYGDVFTTANILESMILQHGLQTILQDSWTPNSQGSVQQVIDLPPPKLSSNASIYSPRDADLREATSVPNGLHHPEGGGFKPKQVSEEVIPKKNIASPARAFEQKSLFDSEVFVPVRINNESEDDKAMSCIKRHLELNSRLEPGDYKKLAQEQGISVRSISFAVSNLLSLKQIDWRKVAHPGAQQLLRPLIPKIKIALPSRAGLKLMKEYAEAELGQTVDYNQLRIALMTHRRHA